VNLDLPRSTVEVPCDFPFHPSAGIHLLTESSGTPSLQPPSQPAEPPYGGSAEDEMLLAEAFALFCAPPELVEPAVRNRVEEFLIGECVRSPVARRVRIASTLLRPTASEQTRAFAEDVLVSVLDNARVE
jgi:hypothetical protein